jgi:uncharacterized protein YqjF (DUF2071 family)
MKNHDFNSGIVRQTSHRPWPMPRVPWVMTQSWHDLLFAHWQVDRDRLAALIPPGLELDLHRGDAWVSVVPFHMTNVAPRGVPSLPWLSAFPEINVRTYVRVGDKPGVYFFSLDATNGAAVAAARLLFGLPYHAAAIDVSIDGEVVRYRSQRRNDPGAAFAATYQPVGPAFTVEPSALAYFLTERYGLYTVGRDGRPRRLEIHHPPWQLRDAVLTLETNTLAARAGLNLGSRPDLLHFASRQDVITWPMTRA